MPFDRVALVVDFVVNICKTAMDDLIACHVALVGRTRGNPKGSFGIKNGNVRTCVRVYHQKEEGRKKK